MKEKKEIAICSNCGAPLISTFFLIPYAEWFCFKCKWSCGMMNAERVGATPELIKLKKQIDTDFKKAKRYYISPTCQRTNCKKCDETRQYHILHVSKRLKTLSDKASKRIFGK